MSYQLLLGDAIEVMRTLPAGSGQTCVTSPPYFGLRSYLPDSHDDKPLEIGTEPTVESYVAKLVDVFREVRRVLHPSGTCWIVIGDSYNGSGGSGGDYGPGGLKEGQPKYPGRNVNGLGPKQLLGIPWRVAFALQADGWILRSEIIWAKKSPMPESVLDRPTKAHEQVFLLAKSASYFYDADAIAEPTTGDSGWEKQRRNGNGFPIGGNRPDASLLRRDVGRTAEPSTTRNKRSVWTLGPESFSGAHFAVMPTKLVEPCILAGSSAHGCCAACGAPWERVVERGNNIHPGSSHDHAFDKEQGNTQTHASGKPAGTIMAQRWYAKTPDVTTGWAATCTCGADVVPCTILDPFVGSGTVGFVSLRHGRNFVGIDLNADYLKLARTRIEQSQPMLFEVG